MSVVRHGLLFNPQFTDVVNNAVGDELIADLPPRTGQPPNAYPGLSLWGAITSLGEMGWEVAACLIAEPANLDDAGSAAVNALVMIRREP